MDAQDSKRARNLLFYIGISVEAVFLINTVWCPEEDSNLHGRKATAT